MKIKFHETMYEMLGTINVIPTHFQATFEKGDNTFDSIVTDTLNTSEITVYNDEDEVEGIYTGYTKRIALYVLSGNESVSVEFENENIQSQIDALTQSLSALNTKVDNITPYTETKTAYFGETEKTFYDVPEGNISVFFDNYNGDYSTERIEDRLVVSFDALEHETNITISIQ